MEDFVPCGDHPSGGFPRRQEPGKAERRTKWSVWIAGICAELLTVQEARTPAAAETAQGEPYCKDSPALAQTKEYFEYDPDKAYAFGLRIRQYVRDRDLFRLFSLVEGELQGGPRRSEEMCTSTVPRHGVRGRRQGSLVYA